MAFEDELREENRKLRHLRFVVGLTMSVISQTDLSLDEAFELVEAVRGFALRLFPGKEAAFDLIYWPRFQRLMKERFNLWEASG